MIRGLYKQPGGKLVGVSVRLSHARRMEDTRAVECHIDGDFFLDGDKDDTWRMLRSMETALERCASEHAGNPTAMQDAAAIAIEKTMLDHPDARIVGMDAQGIAIAFRRAIDGMTADGDSFAIPASSNGVHGRNYADSEVPRARRQDARRQESRSETDSDRSEYARRWRMLRPRIVHDTPRSPQEQMNVDAAWAREVAEGTREPTLRIWEWAAPAVVIGRFQSLEDEVNVRTAHSEGFQIVRRCTGGGAMFIEPGNTITYSLYAPLDFAHGMSIEESYKLCDHWLVEALRGLGLGRGGYVCVGLIHGSSCRSPGGAGAQALTRTYPHSVRDPSDKNAHTTALRGVAMGVRWIPARPKRRCRSQKANQGTHGHVLGWRMVSVRHSAHLRKGSPWHISSAST